MSGEPITVPFTVLVDGREKLPYRFEGLQADAKQWYRPLVVPTEWAHLTTGDYSIKGLVDRVAIERKSLADLYTTLGRRRTQFEREHERLAELDFAAVVVESNWDEAIENPPEWSKLKPKCIHRTFCSWTEKHDVHWHFMSNRRLAEITTFRLLEKFFHHQRIQELLQL